MIEREYYSLVEAAERISGDPKNRDENVRIINDFIHLAATGKIYLLVLAPKIMGVLFDKDNKVIPNPHQIPIRHDYYHISKSDAAGYEAFLANNPNTYRKEYSTKLLYLNDSSGGFVLLVAQDKQTINLSSLHVLTKDMEAYKNENGLTKNISIEDYPKDLQPIIPATKSKEKGLSTTERETLLKLILGMAMDAYGYDPTIPRNNASGGNKCGISSKLALIGISISDDTIRKYLTEAKKLLSPESQ